MAPDDRDRSFEKALERHLRASAPHSAVTGHSASSDVDAPGTACPDAEVLAAYHERLLPSDQMISFKQHIAGCARCQQVLATLEATDELLLESDQAPAAENVVVMPAAAAEPAQAAIPSRAARLAHSPWRQKVFHGANWRWLAPAGALAAGLLLWISFHESRPTQVEIAKNTQQPAAPAFSETSPQVATPQDDELSRQAAKQTPLSSAESRSARIDSRGIVGEVAKKNERAALEGKKSVDQAANKVEALAGNRAPVLSGAPNSDAGQSAMTDDIRPEAQTLSKEALRSAPVSPTPPAAMPSKGDQTGVEYANALPTNAPPPAGVQPALKAKAAASGRQAPQEQDKLVAGPLSLLQKEAMVRSVRERSAVIVTTPDPAFLWRVGPAGTIARSSDTGTTWTVQTSEVIADLLAGSAPSANVCWIVGRDATILRTTDGGAHWQKVSSPATEDLASVFAVSPQQATISTTTAHKTYRTTDAGQTWTLVPNP